MEEAWDQDPDARLSASCVQERMRQLLRHDRLGGDGNTSNLSLSNSTSTLQQQSNGGGGVTYHHHNQHQRAPIDANVIIAKGSSRSVEHARLLGESSGCSASSSSGTGTLDDYDMRRCHMVQHVENMSCSTSGEDELPPKESSISSS